jgi:hypothetical protein
VAVLLAAACILPANDVRACETAPDLRIEVTMRFDAPAVRSDYSLSDIADLARRSGRATEHKVFGFYTGEFGYDIDIAPDENAACPPRIDATVTLRLFQRLIEIGREAAANDCLNAISVTHYQHLAAVDQQVVTDFSAKVALAMNEASTEIAGARPARDGGHFTTLREHLAGVVERAIAGIRDARQASQTANNDPTELERAALACSI